MSTYIYDTELCHSRGPWKKHAYIKKIGEGKNAVYIYNNDYNSAKGIKNYLTESKNNQTKLFGEGYNSITNNIAGKGSYFVFDSENNKHKLTKEELIKLRANDVDRNKKFIKNQNKRIDAINSMSDKDSADFMSREKRLKENSKYWEKQKAKKAREERLAAAEKRKEGWAEEKMIKNLANTEIKPISVKKAEVNPISVKKAEVNPISVKKADVNPISIKRKSKGKKLLDKVFNTFKSKPPVPTLSDPNEKIIKENIIKENILKEDILKEDILKENILKESSPKKKRR